MGWGTEPIACITLALGIWITGGLHLDGLMDTADGLGAGEYKCKEAMRDSRVGASGAQALTIVLLIQLAALIELDSLAPIAIPIATFWGRVSPLWAIGNFQYLHNTGSGLSHHVYWKGLKEIVPSLLIILIIFLSLSIIKNDFNYSQLIIICSAIGIFPAIIVPEFLGRRLGGHSGDSYGASVVFVETFILLLFAVIL